MLTYTSEENNFLEGRYSPRPAPVTAGSYIEAWFCELIKLPVGILSSSSLQ